MATVTPQDREILHTILRNVDDAQLAAHNSARTFRNLLAIVALGLAIGAVVFPSVAGRADPSVLNLVGTSSATASPTPSPDGSPVPSAEPTPAGSPAEGTSPTGSAAPTSTGTAGPGASETGPAPETAPGSPTAAPSGGAATAAAAATGESASEPGPTLRTLATVELWGMVGGLIGALSAVLRIRGSTTPIGLQLAQFAVKLPAGAWTGLVGVILLQSTMLPSIQPAPTHTLAAYAIVFGAGQQALTRFVDQRASALLDKTKTQGETTVQIT
jgi:hypothetical protein